MLCIEYKLCSHAFVCSWINRPVLNHVYAFTDLNGLNKLQDVCCSFQWIASSDSPLFARYGSLATVASILKRGKREDLLPHARSLLKCILASKYQDNPGVFMRKFSIKVIQRIGKANY
jgi:hypothetical protein